MSKSYTGAEIVLKALAEHGVKHIFGYPGGAVLPIYDALFSEERIEHILVRHEQGAAHAAEGYARSTGKPGVLLVTSGPGATNAVTGLTDALLDSIPLICISGQVATHLIGNDAFQEADTVGITRHCTKHNWLVKSADDLAEVMHEAFYVATNGRPGPVLVDIPKDVQFAPAKYIPASGKPHRSYKPQTKPAASAINEAVKLMTKAKKPVFYTGGGVINSGKEACEGLRNLVKLTGFPITSTLMGLGAYPASGEQWLGMLGMHGTYEANMAMYECDLMINIGARFDDRITGDTKAFSPNSQKVHVDIDPSSINKNIMVELPILADCGEAIKAITAKWKQEKPNGSGKELQHWWNEIENWRSRKSLSYKNSASEIKPQYAIERLYELTKNHKNVFITTEVGQ
ncbi:MAG: thiamine pyrophosphate-binding protein, partial [Parvibaculales bacterium]